MTTIGQSRGPSSIIGIVLRLVGQVAGPVLADRDLDALLRKAFTKSCAFNDTGKLLCRVDGERIREARREHGRLLAVRQDAAGIVAAANIEDHELQSVIISTGQCGC